MSIDPYQPCPCGSGKKVRFCCCKDIPAELDKIVRAIEGEQRVAALEHLQRLIAAKGERAALLLLKSTIELQQGDIDAAAETVLRLQQAMGETPANLALRSITQAARGDTVAGIQSLQRAIATAEEQWPEIVIDAVDVLARTLLAKGDILAARGHLLLLADATEGEMRDQAVLRLLRLSASEQVPLLLKQELAYEEPPADAVWREPFELAMQDAAYGEWQTAVDSLEALSAQHPEVAAIRKCIAYVRGWLGDSRETAAAWRMVAAMPSLPLEDRVEAEATAQFVEPQEAKTVDLVRTVYNIADVERLMERFLSDRRAFNLRFDPAELAADDQPPPKAAFALLDRDQVDAAGLQSAKDLPEISGTLLVFGRQTDRAARLELADVRPSRLEAVKRDLEALLGELIALPGEQQASDQVRADFDLEPRYLMPQDLTWERQREIDKELFQTEMLERLPTRPLDDLGGKTPEEAAKDESLRVPLLATVLRRELYGEKNDVFDAPFDFNLLRDRLGLPRLEPIAPGQGFDARRLPLPRMRRVKVDQLSDDDLIVLFHRAARVGDSVALRALAAEVVQRPQFDDTEAQHDKVTAYRLLCGLWQMVPEKAMRYIEEGRKYAIKKGHSPAEFLIAELPYALFQNPDRFKQIVTELQSRHIQEPGVKQQFVSMLSQLGLLRPDGRVVMPQSKPAAQDDSSAKRLWTPESGAPAGAATGSGEKPKLWVPGMD